MICNPIPDLHEVDLRELPKPYEEGRLEVEEHHPQTKVLFDPHALVPCLCVEQLEGWTGIHGIHLANDWRYLATLNAKALDYLERHPELRFQMSKKFEGLVLYFPKTVYIENRRDRFIRYLDFDTWETGDTLLDGHGFSSRCAGLMHPGVRKVGPTLYPLNGNKT